MKKEQAHDNQTFDPLELMANNDPLSFKETEVHIYQGDRPCATDSIGHAEPGNVDPTKIVLDASEGFIPLWAKNSNLRWRFNRNAMAVFKNPEAAKRVIRGLFGQALLAWGDAAPVKFTENEDAWDFEIVVRQSDDCSIHGCTLASAFFPDSGRHRLSIYPKMFTQSKKEQVDTMIHEIGHIFGLRHFFAKIKEQRWASEVFGKHVPFSIMNYGDQSELTPQDKADLKRLYHLVWSGQLTEINGTPIVKVNPFHTLRNQLIQQA